METVIHGTPRNFFDNGISYLSENLKKTDWRKCIKGGNYVVDPQMIDILYNLRSIVYFSKEELETLELWASPVGFQYSDLNAFKPFADKIIKRAKDILSLV
jgi:hypothetical protein